MFVHGARNIAVFTGFFHPSLAGGPALYVSEDRRAAIPLEFAQGSHTPSDWEAINVSGHAIPDGNGQMKISVVHWERAGHNTMHNKVDWKAKGATVEVVLTEFSPITKPGFALTQDVQSSLVETSGFGPQVESALEGDEHSRDLVLRPFSRRMKNQLLVTGVVVHISRHLIDPEPPSTLPFYWGRIALGSKDEDIVDFKIRSVSDNFGGVLARFRSGPTPITLAGALRSTVKRDGTKHVFLDCESAILVSRQDFEGGKPPAWMLGIRSEVSAA